MGFSGSGGSVSGRMQRAVHGVDLATDARPVAVLQDPAGPTGAGGTLRGRNGNGKKAASHFEITKVSSQQVGAGGVIKGWEERTLNMSKAVRYNKEQGTFTVEKAGVYFLFCQVLFNEQESQYVKLDVVTSGQRPQKLQCMEGYGTTPSAGPHPFHFLKPCQVSGLLRLDKGTELNAITGPSFKLHTVGNPSASPHVFSIFKVN
ncbi:tumor necrosis factor ligand superfamily member 12 [Scomber scombrus]|uniref:Tumor necrosis factor ligand superfamily member 12 n=1 Tax=Scomber scombrus TaxID=13677 RepID=A0AAV1N1B8_SCOSC